MITPLSGEGIMRYRAEIDGLRAVAVIPVIFFHAGFKLFSGGFVGVDVFFVISGYLITTIILSELDEGKFSIVNFYERRSRRILPALFVVMAACLPFAWLWLLPQDLKSFSQSLVAVSVFASNVFFWRTSNYFETAVELKPLLHTWSLAVEEQYYVLFPPFLILAWRLGRHWIIAILSAAAVVSLVAAQWGSVAKPAATFYLLPTRGWELLIGAFIAFYFSNGYKPNLRKPVSDVGGFIGFTLIIYSIFSFDKQTPFPSLCTLVPTLGTALIILCATHNTAVGKLLGNKLFVSIGLISYSAYLWHQPIFAFARHRSLEEPSRLVFVVLVLLSLTFAYLSWRFIEIPFRKKNVINRQKIFIYSFVGSVLLAAVGLAGHYTSGFEKVWLSKKDRLTVDLYQKFKVESELNNELIFSNDTTQDNGECRFNARNLTPEIFNRLRQCYLKYGKGFVVLGDSHAIDMYGVMALSNTGEKFLVGFTKAGCRPHTTVIGCQYDEFFSFVQTSGNIFSVVFYVQSGSYLLKADKMLGSREMFSSLPMAAAIERIYPNKVFVDAVADYLRKVSKYVPVVWIGPRVEPHISQKYILRYGCCYNYKLRPNQYEVFQLLDDYIERIVDVEPGISFISQNRMFGFKFPQDLITCDSIYWADGEHFSEEGKKHFGEKFNLLNYYKSGLTQK